MPAQNYHEFGKYKLLRRIAAGGMGEVHLAKLTGPSGFEKLVVIKRLLKSRQTEQKYLDMFFAEARVAAQLGHSNIVQVYEVGTINDVPYIAMEFVHGKSLRKVLDRALKRPTTLSAESVPPGFIAQIISQLCMGLAFAHDARHLSGATIGLVHRDINPHNVLISYQGEVKIIDFGIAKSELSLDQTQAGTIKGTVVYMSPEQSLGERLDKRSDLFSVGICLYEALTGKNPFHKSGMGASLEAIRQAEFPPVDGQRPELRPFAPILARALARQRVERYSDGGQIADALMELLESGQVQKPPVPLSVYMAELFGQEMLEEEQLLERTDTVRNPLMPQAEPQGTRPMMRAPVSESTDHPRETLKQSQSDAESNFATQADLELTPEATVAAELQQPPPFRPIAMPELETAKVAPQELDQASQGHTPNPLLALAKPIWPNGERLMQLAQALGEKPTIRRFWPYIASFAMIFSVMGSIALVTRSPRTAARLPPPEGIMPDGSTAASSQGASPQTAPRATSSPPTTLKTPIIMDGDDPGPLITDGAAVPQHMAEEEVDSPDGPASERRGSRRHARPHFKTEAAPAPSPTAARVQVRADPPLVLQYDNAVINEPEVMLKAISGTLRVGQNPSSDNFIITLNYRMTPRGISYQIDSVPWADVTGPGGVLLGRTPLRWTEPSQLLSLEFSNPQRNQTQRMTLRLVP